MGIFDNNEDVRENRPKNQHHIKGIVCDVKNCVHHDGDNYCIGLVDVTDTPYREFVEANRKFSEQLYRFRRETPPVRFKKGY